MPAPNAPSRPASHPIAAHRVVNGGGSAALIRPDGEIDWWCAPRPDSPPLLWSLLDGAGAAARWRGTEPAAAWSAVTRCGRCAATARC
jgi:hypothetical protein